MLLKLLKKFNKSSNIINSLDLNLTIDYKVRGNILLNSALNSTESIVEELANEGKELIVSLTTYSKRIHDVHLVIESIAQQTLQPNRLILWLDENEFTLETIPLILHKQIERGLEVRFCPNYGSYKKLLPTLEEFPFANIITVDDDVLYPYDMIEILYKEHLQYPMHIIGHYAHKIKFSTNKILLPYMKWERNILGSAIGGDIFLVGNGGILYPPNSLDNKVLDSVLFMELCPNADDVWFKAMALLNNTKCKKVNDDREFFSRFLSIEDSQDIALYNTNITHNDKQINAVFEYYELNKK